MLDSVRVGEVFREDQGRKLAADRLVFSLRHAVIKVTSECNLACTYCYSSSSLPGHGETMSFETAMRIVDCLTRCKSRRGFGLDLCWSGGEILLKRRLLRRILDATGHIRGNDNVIMGIQTNATLLDEGACQLIRETGVYVGISVDGWATLHDSCRRFANGSGSYRLVDRAMRILKAAGVPFGVIAVITRFNCDYAPQMIDWLYSLGIRDAAFNPFMDMGRGSSREPFVLDTEKDLEVSKAIVNRLVEINSRVPPHERFIERNIGALARNMVFLKSRPMCNLRSPCAAASTFLHFEPNGDIYPCDQFADKPDFRLGNIWTDDVDAIWEDHPVVRELRSRTIYNIPQCSACEWRLVCCAGCPGAALREHGRLLSPTPLCRKHKELIPWVWFTLRKQGLKPEVLAFPHREGRGFRAALAAELGPGGGDVYVAR